MNAIPSPLRRLFFTALICLGGVAIAASAAQADSGCRHDGDRGHGPGAHDQHAYDGRGYDNRYEVPASYPSSSSSTPVRYGDSRRRDARACRQESIRQQQLFDQRLVQLQRAEARTVRNAYHPRTRGKAQRVAARARAQARRLTSVDVDRRWRSRSLACRDDVRRFRAATQTIDRSIDKLLRLAARDARYARRYSAPPRQVYTAPRARPTRVVYR